VPWQGKKSHKINDQCQQRI